MANIKKGKISDLVPDLKNINKGSEFGNHLLEKSLRESGAGRSIVVDKNMNVLAGNKTLEKAGELGFENTLIVETTGRDLVVVKRTDLDINSEAGVKYKILDNTVSKHNYVEDAEVMQAVAEEYKLAPEDFGLNSNYFINSNDDLIGKRKEDPPTFKITFKNMKDLLRFEKIFKDLMPQFESCYFSINDGK